MGFPKTFDEMKAAPEMAEMLLTIHQIGMFQGHDLCEIGALLKKAGVL
jgi:hypothetical protein